MTSPVIRRRDLLQYSILAFPLAFAGLPICIHAPDFYAAYIGIPLSGIGTSLLLLRLIDAIQDPLIGWLSDRCASHRLVIMMFAICILYGGFWMVFHPTDDFTIEWFALAIFLCTTGFSTVSINLYAAGGLWQSAHHERTRITAWREALGLLGLLGAAVLPTALQLRYPPRAAFHILCLAYLPLLLAGAVAFAFWYNRAEITDSSDHPRSELPISFLRVLSQSTAVRRFLAVYFVSNLASAIPAILVLFFIRDRLSLEAYSGIFLFLYFSSGAGAMPLWQNLSRRTSKEVAWLSSMLVAVGGFIWALGLEAGDGLQFGVICLLSGTAFGADLALPPSMLADRIAEAGHESLASRYFAALTFLTKSALALATGLILPTLDMLGYRPGEPQGSNAVFYLVVAYALVPCLIKLGAGLMLTASMSPAGPVSCTSGADSREDS